TLFPSSSGAPDTIPATYGAGVPTGSLPFSTENSTESSAVFPAASVARKSTTWSPTSDTLTGDSYGPNSPPSRRYSTDSTPESSSVALITTSAETTHVSTTSTLRETTPTTSGTNK